MPDWQQLLFGEPAAPRADARGWETGLEPTLVAKIQQLKTRAAQEGIQIQVKEGYRSPERQAEIYAQGRTRPGDIITYARPGTSRHQSGRAVDIVPLKDGQPDETSPHWTRLGQLGKEVGLEWGGDWKKLDDKYHFQLPTGTARRQAAPRSTPTPTLDRGPEQALEAAGGIPGLETVTPTFRAKVGEVARRLRMDPQHLLTVMSFETGGTFDPSVRNQAGSGATGLIQFLPKTAQSLGTTTDDLARMTPEQQLDYVERYLRPYAGRMRTQQDAYMAVLSPAAIGKPESHVLFQQGTRAYDLNQALDKEQTGRVTIGDTMRSIGRHLGAGRSAAPGPRDWARELGLGGGTRTPDAASALPQQGDWRTELFPTAPALYRDTGASATPAPAVTGSPSPSVITGGSAPLDGAPVQATDWAAVLFG